VLSFEGHCCLVEVAVKAYHPVHQVLPEVLFRTGEPQLENTSCLRVVYGGADELVRLALLGDI